MIDTVATAITIFIALISLFSWVAMEFAGCELFASFRVLFFLKLIASKIVVVKTMKKVTIGKTTDL